MPLPPPAAGLPPKPGTQTVAEAGPSSSKCACGAAPKYTCPRCATRTCSLPCSKAHKQTTGCSGQRDPAAFVPLTNYTQGTWDGDYAWLEATRRQVAEWGEGLEVDAGRPQGRGKPKPRKKPKEVKLDSLRWAMREIGVDVDILPEGMQRRRENQSSWNPKSRALYLTVQLVMGSLGENVTHPRVHVLPSNLTTLGSLLPEGLDRQGIVLAMPYHSPKRLPAPAPAPRGVTRYFSPLDPSLPVSQAFEGTSFVEFPQIRVFTTAEWQANVGNGRIAVIARQVKARPKPEAPPPAKKVKLDGMALAGLGAYGDSDDDDEVEGVVAGEDDGASAGSDKEEEGDVTLAPEMAAALGAALVADFGP